jgi:hypothetical protein
VRVSSDAVLRHDVGMTDEGWRISWPNDRVWVRLTPGWTPDPDILWRVEGNAHTHRGHFHVSALDGTLTRTVNATDVVDASLEGRFWLGGFLRGQEATLFEFMGRSEELLDGVDDDDLARWQDWNARFRLNGSAPPLNDLPPSVEVLRHIVEPVPWCHVAGRYWVWRDGGWLVASPQPDGAENVAGWAWPDTVCASRRHHSLEVHGVVAVCQDCHEVTGPFVDDPDIDGR